MTAIPSIRTLRAVPFLAVLALLVLVALMGGASRSDVASLPILRPLAALFLGIGLLSLTRETVARFRFLFGFTAVTIAVVAIQLIPLPYTLWSVLPGREFVSEIDALAGVGKPWRPITLTPFETWNALYSLIVPLAMLVLLAQLSREQRYGLLPLLLVLGVASGTLGIMQVIGPPSGPLYLYRVTNFTSAVGLFANRNHQAVLLACLFPMLAVFARLVTDGGSLGEARTRGWIAFGVGALLVPLLLVTGSRLGLLVGGVGLVSILALLPRNAGMRKAGRPARARRVPLYVAAGVAVIALIGATITASRAEAVKRLFAIGGDESRVPIWQTTLDLTAQFFPVGAGYGSFIPVFQIAESDQALDTTFTNHAHNELLEVALTGGIPGLLLIAIAVAAWIRTSWYAFSTPLKEGRSVLFARLGSILILILGIASVTDYPVRTPFLASLLVIAAVWLAGIGEVRSHTARARQASA